MGNNGSSPFKVCGSSVKKEPKLPPMFDDDVADTELDSNIVQRNKDNYFDKADYDRILEKYPLFKEWVEQSANAQYVIVNPNQKKIKWKEAEVIGNGSYGRVVMGLDLQTGSIMAVKQVQLGNMDSAVQQERIKALEVEIDLLSKFSNKNIVRYHGCHRDANTLNIFLEYISGGTIASLLEKYGTFNENLIRVYTRQILQGLEYLHVRNAIHRDIKGANVLVDNSGICKLADFGTAKRISKLVDTDFKGLSLKGTVQWMAPEVLKQSSLTRFCDIWSVGCTVIEMATGKPPWDSLIKPSSNSISTLYQIAQTKTHPPIPKTFSPEAVDFLKQCFRLDPHERPNVLKLLQHRFIAGVENIYQGLDSKAEAAKKMNQEYVTRTNHPKPSDKNAEGDKNKLAANNDHQNTGDQGTDKYKSSNILHELQDGQNENQTGSLARLSNNAMTNHTIHQTTKPNFTIVSKQKSTNKDSSIEDVKQNAKTALRAKLAQNNLGPFSVEGPFGHDGPSGLQDDFIAINGFPVGSRNNNNGNHIQFKIREDPASKRGFPKEQKYFVNNKIVEEREDQVYPDNGWKEGVEFKNGIVSYRKDGDALSDSSRDSDKDPSMLVVSALKNSKNSYAVENTSNISVRGGMYGGMSGMSLHDQSSRMSFRKDRSFDVRGEQFQSESGSYIQNKEKWRSKNELELPKAPSRYKSGVPQVSHENKNHHVISQDDIVIEEGRTNKRHGINMMSSSKENYDSNNQDLKKFNLLDDLDNIYNQLESRNVPE